jgi:hypothetical protein
MVIVVVSLVVGGWQTNLNGDTRWLPSRARAGAARASRYTTARDAGQSPDVQLLKRYLASHTDIRDVKGDSKK